MYAVDFEASGAGVDRWDYCVGCLVSWTNPEVLWAVPRLSLLVHGAGDPEVPWAVPGKGGVEVGILLPWGKPVASASDGVFPVVLCHFWGVVEYALSFGVYASSSSSYGSLA